ncbi:MAG: metal-dependent transcriptional regulator [Treponemataceae bacterium]
MKATISQEDYLETIYDLSVDGAEVKSVDVARARDVSRASINKAIPGLRDGGFIEQEPYGKITLTKKGLNLAKEIRKRHDIIKSFLEDVLGVVPAVAEEEACKIEHVVSADTIKKLCAFINKTPKVK